MPLKHAAAERCAFVVDGERCRRPRDHDPQHIAHVLLVAGKLRLFRDRPHQDDDQGGATEATA